MKNCFGDDAMKDEYRWLGNKPISRKYKIAKYKFARIEPTAIMTEDEADKMMRKMKRVNPTALFKKIKVR